MVLWVLTQKYKFESNSQQLKGYANYKEYCEFSHKNTNLKAIHNLECQRWLNLIIVSSHTKIQIWKQFTTTIRNQIRASLLWVLTQKYKFESNSQPNLSAKSLYSYCEFSHKNTNLKAIHNFVRYYRKEWAIVSSHTKIQIWKQFTTVNWNILFTWSLWVLTQKYKFETLFEYTWNYAIIWKQGSTNTKTNNKDSELKQFTTMLHYSNYYIIWM